MRLEYPITPYAAKNFAGKYAVIVFIMVFYLSVLTGNYLFIDPYADAIIFMATILPLFGCLFYFSFKQAKLIITPEKVWVDNRLLSWWRECKPFAWKDNISTYEINQFQRSVKIYQFDSRRIKALRENDRGVLVVDNKKNNTLSYISTLYWQIDDVDELKNFINSKHKIQQLDNREILERYYPDIAISPKFIWASVSAMVVCLIAMSMMFFDDYSTLDFGYSWLMLSSIVLFSAWFGYRWIKRDDDTKLHHQLFFSVFFSLGIALLASQLFLLSFHILSPANETVTFKLTEIEKDTGQEIWVNDTNYRVFCKSTEKPLNSEVELETKRLFSLVRINQNQVCN